MRAVLELSGIRDVLAKSMGSTNSLNVIRATVKALQSLQSREALLAMRREENAA
jgi:small subunit ribosomal protein S5